MSHNVTPNPWQINGSDSEEDSSSELEIKLPLSKRSTSLISGKPQTPVTPDWNPITTEKLSAGKSKRKKHSQIPQTPSFRGPVFVAQHNGKPVSSKFLQKNEAETQKVIPLEASENSKYSSQCITSSDFNPSIFSDVDSNTNPDDDASDVFNFSPDIMILEDLKKFIYTPVPRQYTKFVQCCLQRDKSGFQKGLFPTYYLHAKRPEDGKKMFLLAARKVGKLSRQAEYIISHAVETLSEKSGGEGFVGKLLEHETGGIQYTLYDNGLSAHKFKKEKEDTTETLRRELLSIIYKSNRFGFRGPRQMNVIMPKKGHDIQPKKGDKTLHDLWNDRRFTNLIQLRNRAVEDLDGKKKYKLQFIGTYDIQSSIKNFQMVMDNENSEEEIVMQFGRIDDDKFICDYRYPLSAIQAFAIALSSFESRIGRD